MFHVLLAVALFLGPNPAPDNEVNNGLSPKAGGFQLDFVEELRFGADEEGDEYLWADQNVDIAVNKDGQIFIGDPKVNEIREFDKNGKFVRILAKKGPGPGELGALNRMQFLADGRFVVFESKPMFLPKFQIFTKDLVFEKTISAGGGIPLSAILSPKGDLYSGIVLQVNPTTGSMITKTGVSQLSDFSMIKEYSTFENKVNFKEMGNSTVLSDMIGNMIKGLYNGMGVFAYDKDGNIYSALTNSYEITKWSPDHKTKLMTIKKEYKPIINSKPEILAAANRVSDKFRSGPFASMVNDEFVNRIIEKADLPEVKPPIAGLTVLPEGQILVVHDFNIATGIQKADIFDAAGNYRGTATRENWFFLRMDGNFRAVFQKGKAYVIDADDEDNNRLVRYAYKISK